jgi:hypothetical protein
VGRLASGIHLLVNRICLVSRPPDGLRGGLGRDSVTNRVFKGLCSLGGVTSGEMSRLGKWIPAFVCWGCHGVTALRIAGFVGEAVTSQLQKWQRPLAWASRSKAQERFADISQNPVEVSHVKAWLSFNSGVEG